MPPRNSMSVDDMSNDGMIEDSHINHENHGGRVGIRDERDIRDDLTMTGIRGEEEVVSDSAIARTVSKEITRREAGRFALKAAAVLGGAYLGVKALQTGYHAAVGPGHENLDYFWESEGEDALDRIGLVYTEQLKSDLHPIYEGGSSAHDQFCTIVDQASEKASQKVLKKHGEQKDQYEVYFLRYFYQSIAMQMQQAGLRTDETSASALLGKKDDEGRTYQSWEKVQASMSKEEDGALCSILTDNMDQYIQSKGVTLSKTKIDNAINPLEKKGLIRLEKDQNFFKDVAHRLL